MKEVKSVEVSTGYESWRLGEWVRGQSCALMAESN